MVSQKNINNGEKGSAKQKIKRTDKTTKLKRKLDKEHTERQQESDDKEEPVRKRIKNSNNKTETKLVPAAKSIKKLKEKTEEPKPSTSAAAREAQESHRITRNTKTIKPVTDRVTRSSSKLLFKEIQAAAGYRPQIPKAANSDDLHYSLDEGSNRNTNKKSTKRGLLKISSWNIAGLRSWMNKNGLKFLKNENPDIFCMQEIKRNPNQIPEKVQSVAGYYSYWLSLPGDRAGVALYTKVKPMHIKYGIGVAEFDIAGRLITAEYKKFYLINVYVPNSGQNLVNLKARLRWDKRFQVYVKKLNAQKPVIICGDMNVAHQEIDLANPKSNTHTAGFTIEERENMTKLLALGFVDTFRLLYPDKQGAYTFWTYRANARKQNIGWRLDYFIVSKRISNRVVDSIIQSRIKGSDHCPITMFIKMSF